MGVGLSSGSSFHADEATLARGGAVGTTGDLSATGGAGATGVSATVAGRGAADFFTDVDGALPHNVDTAVCTCAGVTKASPDSAARFSASDATVLI
jgi:uncharacterized Zn finger protein